MNHTLQDYKNLLLENGALDYRAEAGQSCREMYEYSGYLDWLISLCKKYNIEFDKDKIEWEWGNYIQSKTYELEKKLEKLLMPLNTEKTFSQILEEDLNNCRNLIKENLYCIDYDEEVGSWYIDGVELVDELYYDCYTNLHPKEIVGYVEDLIIDEFKIPETGFSCMECGSFHNGRCIEKRSIYYNRENPSGPCHYFEGGF